MFALAFINPFSVVQLGAKGNYRLTISQTLTQETTHISQQQGHELSGFYIQPKEKNIDLAFIARTQTNNTTPVYGFMV